MDRIRPRVTGLAIALGFPQHIIDILETKQEPVYYLLKEWLNGRNQEVDSRKLTWATLITALGEAGLLEEVKVLQERFVAAASSASVAKKDMPLARQLPCEPYMHGVTEY